MPRPGQPEFFGYPPQAVAPPAGWQGPVYILIIGDQALRRKHVELGRPPSIAIAGGAREIVLAGQDTADVKPRKFLQLKFALLKFFWQLFLRRLQTSDAVPPPTAERDEKAMFELVLRSNRGELSRQLQQAIGDHDATAFFKDGLSALQAYMLFVLSSLLGELFNNSRPPYLAGDFSQQSAEHD